MTSRTYGALLSKSKSLAAALAQRGVARCGSLRLPAVLVRRMRPGRGVLLA